MSNQWDVIVIGSGMGGMVTAAALSKLGHKVLMLEQYDSLGGQTHSFSREGFSWDVGLHYLGGFGPEVSERAMLDWLCDSPIELGSGWVRLRHAAHRRCGSAATLASCLSTADGLEGTLSRRSGSDRQLVRRDHRRPRRHGHRRAGAFHAVRLCIGGEVVARQEAQQIPANARPRKSSTKSLTMRNLPKS